MKTVASHFQTVFSALEAGGFLLASDPKLPSVCSLITGEPLPGSWWSHPMAQIIFQVNEQLDDNEDVLITKLISGKVTFVHRKIWSEVVQIASAREAWQLNKLPLPAKTLLEQVDAAGSLTTAEVSWPKQTKMKLGDAARELEKRLLIVGTQFHSETGAHQKQLETWNHWMKRRKFNPVKKSIAEAKGQLELILGDLNKRCNASGRFPWQ